MSYQMFWLLFFLIICVLMLIAVLWYIRKRLWTTTLTKYEIECPIDFEWKFTKADLIVLKDSVDGFWQGRCFYPLNIPGLQCYLRIFPNGNAKEYRGQTWIFFYVNGSRKEKMGAEFKFFIESANYSSESFNTVFEQYGGYGAKICKTSKFFDWKSKYFMDEEITIKVKGILKAQRSSISTISIPISFQWKIKEDDLKEAMEPESRNHLCSPFFNTTASIRDLRYYFTIYPNKFDVHRNKVGVSVYLNVELRNEKKAKAVFDISTDSASFRCNEEHVYEKTEGYGGLIFSTEDLFDSSKGYIVDGYLTINFNGVLLVERNRRMTIKCKNGFVPRSAQQDVANFLIVVGEKQIPVHKEILMDVSPVWAGMVESGMKESLENKMVIKDFPFKVVAAAIKIFYNKNGFCSLTMEEMFLLLKFGDKYFIESLLNHVERALIKIISPSNVCQLIQLSAPNSCNLPKLHQSCIKFLGYCFKKSTPVYGADTLGDKFLGKIFLRGLHYVSDSDTPI